jgi:CBS domain-containing protein
MKRGEMKELTVKDVMTHLVVTVRPQDKIADAAKRLLSNRISGAPVVDGGRLVGVVSEADLVKAFMPPSRGLFPAPYPLMFLLVRGIPRPEARYSTVGDVMTKDVVTIGPNAGILEAASLIDRYGVRRLPVVGDDGWVIGILARSDLVRCMARSHEERWAS